MGKTIEKARVMKKYLFLLIIFASISCVEPVPESSDWDADPNNPIIDWGDAIDEICWNDPSVMKEDSIYVMWLSGGPGDRDDGQINYVSIYRATSSDGIIWEINPNILITHGEPGDWDDEKIETPMVVKVDDTYHLYYCAYKTGDGPGQYNIGHATSPDGINWTKDPNNPIITFHDNPDKWGYYQAAEPGVIYKDNKFYLYYVTARRRPGYSWGNISFQQGIALAISDDGSHFVNYDPDDDGELNVVLTQSQDYPPEDGFGGYSTPFPVIDDLGKVHLFYDVAQYVHWNDWRQVAICHAVSDDGGFTFHEIETNIFTYAHEDWKKWEVRSPSVIIEDGMYKMWFAGNNDLFFQEGFHYGIGYATSVR